MNRKIDELLPHAFKAIEESNIPNGEEIDRKYNGYVASFGASVIQSGMLAALVFNHQSVGDEGTQREKLMNIIFEVIKKQEEGIAEENLLAYYRARPDQGLLLKQRILNIATALKLVMRTYKLVKLNEGRS